jgi:glycerol-3-phosphate dehydrogenase
MQQPAFSSANRQLFIEQLQTQPFDLLVIGGGITGAGIALDAASRGLKVALVEKQDFASGTSSRSTKLIHGGLRYLKQLEFELVRTVGQERAVVHRLAPHLVVPEKMLLPLVKKGTYGAWATSVGLWVYDWLAGVAKAERRQMLDRQQTLQQEPLLNPDKVIGGGLYVEYRTDDARLCIENIKTAYRYGATLLNYARVTAFLYDDQGKVSGATIQDQLGGQQFDLQASCVVNATGPWVDTLRAEDGSLQHKHLFLTKGIHLVVSQQKFPLQQAVYFDIPNGRMIFAIPRHDKVYIGTTDTAFEGNLEEPEITTADLQELLDAIPVMFPQVRLSLADIESTWSGLRPLIFEEGKSPSELSRKDEVFISPTGLVSIAGGKLTGYRKMAQKVVDLVVKRSPKKSGIKPCQTQHLQLSAESFQDYAEVTAFIQQLAQDLEQRQLPAHYAGVLVHLFGKAAQAIVQRWGEYRQQGIETTPALFKAAFDHCWATEMIALPDDFARRRTALMYFDMEALTQQLPNIIDWFAEAWLWDEAQKLTALKQLQVLITQHSLSNFKKIMPSV